MPKQLPSASASDSSSSVQRKITKPSKAINKPKATATVVSKKNNKSGEGTSVTVNIEYPSHYHRGRKFYKGKNSKKKSGDGETGDNSDTTPGDEARKALKYALASKRAKIAHYQKRDSSVVSWYSVRNSINQHLKYRIQKYPVPGLREMMTDLNSLACTISGDSKPVVYGGDGEKISKGKGSAPQFQISETAVDMLTFYVGKKAERRLARAAVFSAARKVQTVAVEDLIMAEDSLYGTLS